MKLFISYAHVDQKIVEHVSQILESAGHIPWVDEHDLVGGKNWEKEIENGIKSCDTFIFAMSPASVVSEYCLKELEIARRFKKFIIPVLIKDTDIPSHLKLTHYVDFREVVNPKSISKLFRAINASEQKNTKFIPLLVFTLIIVSLLTGYFLIRQSLDNPTPPTIVPTLSIEPMNGDFNIAVAQIAESYLDITDSNNSMIGSIISDGIISALEESDFLSNISGFKVQHREIGVVSGLSEAERIAEELHAHIIIYGRVVVGIGAQEYQLDPNIYVVEPFQPALSELAGYHDLNLEITLTPPQIGSNEELQSRLGLIVNFIKGLAYLSNNDLELALDTFQQAIDQTPITDLNAQKVVYLYAATTARLLGKFEMALEYINEALDIDSEYRRALLAKANIYHEQGMSLYDIGDIHPALASFNEALPYYQVVASSADQLGTNFIQEKGILGAGIIYTIQYIAPGTTNKDDRANNALSNFEQLITEYQRNSAEELREMVAEAYYWSGVIYHSRADVESAKNAYEQTLTLTNDADTRQKAQAALDALGELEN